MERVDALAARFDVDGYVVVPDVFDDELMARLDRLLDDHFGAAPEFVHDQGFIDDTRAEVVPWFPVRDDGVVAFEALGADEFVRSLTGALLGAGWSSQYCMAMHSRAGSAGQPWHQDCPPEDPAVYNLNRLVYTRDIDPGDGGQLVVLPGSHRRGVIPTGDLHEDFDDQVVIAPRRGTLVMVHGHCWHRVMPVRHRDRVSINERAAPATTPDDVTDVCVYRNMRYRFSTATVIERRMPAVAGPS